MFQQCPVLLSYIPSIKQVRSTDGCDGDGDGDGDCDIGPSNRIESNRIHSESRQSFCCCWMDPIAVSEWVAASRLVSYRIVSYHTTTQTYHAQRTESTIIFPSSILLLLLTTCKLKYKKSKEDSIFLRDSHLISSLSIDVIIDVTILSYIVSEKYIFFLPFFSVPPRYARYLFPRSEVCYLLRVSPSFLPSSSCALLITVKNGIAWQSSLDIVGTCVIYF